MVGIYKFTNRTNGKIYIGQAVDINARYNRHFTNAQNGEASYFYNALRKYGKDGFDFEVIKECNEDELDYWETYYIAYYNSNSHNYGYNMTIGGDGLRNPCQETRDKISNNLKEWYKDEGHRQLVSERTREAMQYVDKDKLRTQLNKPRSEEVRKKISASLKGRKKPEGFGQHLSEVQKGRTISKEQCIKISIANSGQIGLNNGIIQIRIKPEQIDEYLNKGYVKGRLPFSEDAKHNMSLSHIKTKSEQ